MIDISQNRYLIILLTEDGRQINITDFVQNAGWEEGKGELAMRISMTLFNGDASNGRLSDLAKPGCMILIYAGSGQSLSEAARGRITDWGTSSSGNDEKFTVTAYDELYNLQESQDNVYYSAGTGTKTAVLGILNDWGIPAGVYEGPDVPHAKLEYKSESISDILLDLLDDAYKKGAPKCILRSENGKISVIPRGKNATVYHFAGDSTKVASNRISTGGMATRVKVMGQENKGGQARVEAVVDGDTRFGIRQKIYRMEKKDSLQDAKTAAQSILNEKGIPQTDITVEAPDVPYIRKGDLVHIQAGTLDGNYYVNGIRHDADTRMMSMELEKAEAPAVAEAPKSADEIHNVGDIVTFKGGNHYVSSVAGSKGYAARPGPAKITKKAQNGAAHPWHLIHTDGSSNVYGWVDNGTF